MYGAETGAHFFLTRTVDSHSTQSTEESIGFEDIFNDPPDGRASHCHRVQTRSVLSALNKCS